MVKSNIIVDCHAYIRWKTVRLSTLENIINLDKTLQLIPGIGLAI